MTTTTVRGREITVLFEELLARTSSIELTGPPIYQTLGLSNPVLLARNELPVRLS